MKKKSVRSGAIRNLESARVSIIGQLKKLETSGSQACEGTSTAENIESPIDASHAVMQTQIAEEDESSEEAAKKEERKSACSSPDADDVFKKPQNVKN